MPNNITWKEGRDLLSRLEDTLIERDRARFMHDPSEVDSRILSYYQTMMITLMQSSEFTHKYILSMIKLMEEDLAEYKKETNNG